MEIPDRVKQQLDGESIQSAVSLGDEDVICFTPSRALLYRGEGLLSDESLAVYDHDVERLNVAEGRRKVTFELEYVDSVEKFKITKKRMEPVLTRLLAGVLDTKGITEGGETVEGVFLLSELTLVVTDKRLVKHIGSYVWDPDFEEYPYSEVTGLEFEEGSVATQLVVSVSGRPQRIKASNDDARKIRRTLSEALFAYHDVDSLEALNEKIGEQPDPAETERNDGFSLDDSISPLVSDSSDAEADGTSDTGDENTAVVAETGVEGTTAGPSDEGASATADQSDVDPSDIAALRTAVSELTTAVERQQEQLDSQSEQLEQQRETIETLIEELRQRL
ncbi:MAG: DUF7115 domain-containing protein [Halobacteriota archaeon]